MRYLVWTLKLAVFVLVLTFAVMNTDPVAVRYYFGAEWRAPLVLVLLIAFCAGVAAGLFAGLGQIFRQRREIAALKRDEGRPGQERAGGGAKAAAQPARADGT